ncbi:haloacid dehalogenase-like hydrolase [Jannaschia aquimarina]|uniref:Haloacid dehalogenase-like hydrolase n=1 Tax=Jannaschia aquimarina TaxID=935700 RepID=A0A0D1D4U0_9RHOB|nr:haloacid dehalogenase-like hydrolase [Jannaschia aquimarina]KIT15088.1 haloacid dehalogenase-like hydrolase [Jannaschia aquimarina]SNS63749.1 haloacid dehalogenase-like hydrolase [Jannaschia aquimarina]
MQTTRPHIPRILLAFDYDRTLASDSIDAICAAYEIDRSEWERTHEEPLGTNWDNIIRRGQALIDMGRARERPLSKDLFEAAAGHIELFPGVLDMPERLRAAANDVADGIEMEFVILSSGYDELISRTGVVDVFDRILASGFESDEDGNMICVKRIIGHPEKALYLEALGKGADIDGQNGPERAGDHVEPDKMHVPFDQMIYLGDGLSDLQAFEFLHRAGGLTIAVAAGGSFDPGEITDPQRVDAAPTPNYEAGRPLMQALEHATRACAHRIALRRIGAA